jgi:uncharacterized membrane protein
MIFNYHFAVAIPVLVLALIMAVFIIALLPLWWPERLRISNLLGKTLIILRIIVILLIFYVLLEPMIRKYTDREIESAVAVLWDNSESMGIRDMPRDRSRWEEAKRKLVDSKRSPINDLSDDFKVQNFIFDSSSRLIDTLTNINLEGKGTNIVQSIRSAIREMGSIPLAAIVLVTDGADNSGMDMDKLLGELREQGISLYTCGAGGVASAKDIEVSGISVNQQLLTETKVDVEIEIKSTGFDGKQAEMFIFKDETTENDKVEQRKITLKDGVQYEKVTIEPGNIGLNRYLVQIHEKKNEAIKDNNIQPFAVNNQKRTLNILYMEGSDTKEEDRELYEFQYLPVALNQDPSINIRTMIRDQNKAVEELDIFYVKHPTKGFPNTREELFKYDVIINSDIDITYFSRDQLEMMVEFVRDHGGGYVMVGGYMSFGSGGYDDTVIDRMLPVDMNDRTDGYFEKVNAHWQIPADAYAHPIMQILPDPVENQKVFERMPRFTGFNKTIRLKPGATLLAYYPGLQGNVIKNLPMLAIQSYGKGRVMAFTSDTTAGWGRNFCAYWGDGDNRYFAKFWQNAVRWLAAERVTPADQFVLLKADKNIYSVGDDMQIEVSVLDKSYRPATDVEVSLSINNAAEIKVPKVPTIPGRFKMTIKAESPMLYKLEAVARMGETEQGRDKNVLWVVEKNPEYFNYQLNEELLNTLADETGGKYYQIDKVGDIAGDIKVSTHRERDFKDFPIWDSPFLVGLMVLLLCVEWAMRRRQGLP